MAHLPPSTFHPHSKLLVPTTRPYDARTDEEIAQYIVSYRPVVHEKNIWAFWDKGWDALSSWKQRNVIDWVRRLGAEWEVRVLDIVPGSRQHIQRYVDMSMLPPTFNKMDGQHSGQHRSDILRVLLIYLTGGFWVDVGAVIVWNFDDIWNKITDSNDPIEVMGIAGSFGSQSILDRPLCNTILAAAKGNMFMGLWHRVFAEAYKNRTSASGIRDHPLWAHLTPLKLPEMLAVVEVSGEEVNDYIGQFHAAGRLFALEDPNIGWDGPRFLQEKLMLLGIDEMFMHNILAEFQGEREFAIFALPRNEPLDRSDPEQVAAEAFVETVLGKSVIVKFSQGLMPKPIPLATIWDRPENHGADVKSGTWAEYFRWGSVHLDQQRELQPWSKERKAAQSLKVWTAGVMDIIDANTPVRETAVL